MLEDRLSVYVCVSVCVHIFPLLISNISVVQEGGNEHLTFIYKENLHAKNGCFYDECV